MENHDDIVKTLTTLRDYLRWSVSRFTQSKLYFGHGTDNAWDEAIRLIYHLIHLPLDTPEVVLDSTLTKSERRLIVQLIETRCHDRVPVAYITNEAFFAGLSFKVDERVLIPRSPIAELIENAFQPWCPHPIARVLDLCTGSGCIGIACVTHLDCEADLADISPDALELARQNVARHGLSKQTKLIQSDLFESINGRYDLIVTNPPYVDEQDLADMPAEYHHEPTIGLAAGGDGLLFARKILAQAAQYLTDEGVLVMEVGNSEAALNDAFPQLAITWIEFERGGHGVCVLTRSELQAVVES